MKIKEILDELNLENGSNYKIKTLGKYTDNDLLKRVIYLASSRRVKFYIKQIPSYIPFSASGDHSLENALDNLSLLSTRTVTGHTALNVLKSTLQLLMTEDAYIIERIIEKDLKIGMGTTNINKVFPKLIEKTPYMGALPFDANLVKELFANNKKAIVQCKMDGRYSNGIIRSGDIETESRQGESTYFPGAKFLKEMGTFEDCVLNGELTMDGVSRYISNGMIASMTSIGEKMNNLENVDLELSRFSDKHGKTYEEALDLIVYTVWDVIGIDEYFEFKSPTPYSERLELLKDLVARPGITQIRLVEGKIVDNYEEAIEYFQFLLNRGEEGGIIKSLDGGWVNGKKKHQLKMKLELTVDLEITGFNYGTGKNSDVISSVNAKSSDGIVKTAPTGIKEDEMIYITNHQYDLLGTIVECKCNGLSVNSIGEYSLLHPVYVKSRIGEKTIADSFKDIQDNENMVKGLK